MDEDKRPTFAELYAKASEAEKEQVRDEVREALVELGLLLGRIHDVSGQLQAALGDSALLNDMTTEVLTDPRRIIERYSKRPPVSKPELSESKPKIGIGMAVIINERKGGKYAGKTGTVLQIIADVATIRMDELRIDLEQPVSLLRPYEPEDDE